MSRDTRYLHHTSGDQIDQLTRHRNNVNEDCISNDRSSKDDHEKMLYIQPEHELVIGETTKIMSTSSTLSNEMRCTRYKFNWRHYDMGIRIGLSCQRGRGEMYVSNHHIPCPSPNHYMWMCNIEHQSALIQIHASDDAFGMGEYHIMIQSRGGGNGIQHSNLIVTPIRGGGLTILQSLASTSAPIQTRLSNPYQQEHQQQKLRQRGGGGGGPHLSIKQRIQQRVQVYENDDKKRIQLLDHVNYIMHQRRDMRNRMAIKDDCRHANESFTDELRRRRRRHDDCNETIQPNELFVRPINKVKWVGFQFGSPSLSRRRKKIRQLHEMHINHHLLNRHHAQIGIPLVHLNPAKRVAAQQQQQKVVSNQIIRARIVTRENPNERDRINHEQIIKFLPSPPLIGSPRQRIRQWRRHKDHIERSKRHADIVATLEQNRHLRQGIGEDINEWSDLVVHERLKMETSHAAYLQGLALLHGTNDDPTLIAPLHTNDAS